MLFILHTQILILSGSRAEAVRYTLVSTFSVFPLTDGSFMQSMPTSYNSTSDAITLIVVESFSIFGVSL